MWMHVGILNAMKRQGGGGGGEILSVYACGHTKCYEEIGGEILSVCACGHSEWTTLLMC